MHSAVRAASSFEDIQRGAGTPAERAPQGPGTRTEVQEISPRAAQVGVRDVIRRVSLQTPRLAQEAPEGTKEGANVDEEKSANNEDEEEEEV